MTIQTVTIKSLRTDGGTQSRVELNEQVVAEYAQAYEAGVAMPPVVAFHDGAHYWLADGYHRRFGAAQAGKVSLDCEVRAGTRRDAVLYSVGANAAHGLRRTNADKRRAVMTLLDDEEWSKLSNRDIAAFCGVTHPFVAGLRQPAGVVTVTTPTTVATPRPTPAPPSPPVVTQPSREEQREERQEEERAQPPVAIAALDAAPPPPPPAEPDPQDQLRSALAESAQLLAETQADNESMAKIFEADDKLAEAVEQIKQLKSQVSGLRERVNGLMVEKNAAIQQARHFQRQLEKLQKAAA